MIIVVVLLLSTFGCGRNTHEGEPDSVATESLDTTDGVTEDMSMPEAGPGNPPDGAPMGEPGGMDMPPGMEQTSTKISLTEGDWSFDLVTIGENTTATITYYAGKTDEIVIVPSILGGANVTSIASYRDP